MAPTAIDKAINERDSVMAQLSIHETELATNTTTPLTIVEVDYHLEEIKILRDEAAEVHKRILHLNPTDIAQYFTENGRIVAMVSKLTCGFRVIRSTLSAAGSSNPRTTYSDSGIRLPKMELPTFNGELNSWLSFKDQFDAAVHNNPRLSDSQKLTYLKSALKGNAEKLVASMACTDANYDLAWKALKDRYQNERELVFAVLRKFTNQRSSEGSAANLRSVIDVSKECIRSMKTLLHHVEHWDVILVFTILQKLDPETRKEWELSMGNTDLPRLDPFLDFLEQRARALASMGSCKSSNPAKAQSEQGQTQAQQPKKTQVFHADQPTCKLCSGTHLHVKCPSFVSMSPTERRDAVTKNRLCYNCFRDNHMSNKCTKEPSCTICKGKHHTMIHISKPSTDNNHKDNTTPTITTHSNDGSFSGRGMLATAMVKILDKFNQPQLCRAFLDAGAMSSFITGACANRLGLSRMNKSIPISGIGGTDAGVVKGICKANIMPYFHTPGDESYDVQMLILPTLTAKLPTAKINTKDWTHLDGLQLADQQFFKPANVDILLGADIFFGLLLDGRKQGPVGTPMAINSKLGWLVAGTHLNMDSTNLVVNHSDSSLDETLQKFWELEAVSTTKVLSPEEQKCENHFQSTSKRDKTGRFTVSLPFNGKESNIGSTRDIAVRRLLGLERRLSRLPDQKQQYINFMREYSNLGHMELIPQQQINREMQITSGSSQRNPDDKQNQPKVASNHFYIPHHFVKQDSSTTTKFRVVFDASAKSSSGVSLNDALMVGPTIQDNLVNILMRFRINNVAFSADIAKMYRQVRVRDEDCDWQRILWREAPTDKIQDYRLLTVTYGTGSGPFHAIRALKQLAEDERINFPRAAKIIEENVYVDDLMGGDVSDDDAIEVQSQIQQLISRGGMEIRKWSSNSQKFLESIPTHLRANQTPLSLDKDGIVKTLGLHWNPALDIFTFKVQLDDMNPSVKVTKRILLSEMSRVFDPLGWLSPVTIRAKLLFQDMWKTGLGWDETIPNSTLKAWKQYRDELPIIQQIRISRCFRIGNSARLILHGFSDASELAYSACVYICSHDSQGPPVSNLIIAKTKVAPVKQISIPRLELCGALLLIRLLKLVRDSLKLNLNSIFTWTDSTIVLDWIRGHSSKWKTFVANRIAEIQEDSTVKWGHVKGTEGTDCASRGIGALELLNHPLWWHGPSWILDEESYSNRTSCPDADMKQVESEMRRITISTALISDNDLLCNKYSSLTRLKRITAWCLRFSANCKSQVKKSGALSCEELEYALMRWIRIIQQHEFQAEIESLRANRAIPIKSRLRSLNPFLDETQTLRVGGRLRNAKISSDQRNPIFLPKHHHITKLIIHHEHKSTFHGGPQLVMSNLQRRFWIIGAKDTIQHQIRECVRCTRHRKTTLQQFMGDLPVSRVTPTRPFLTCGVDYAGPFILRAIPNRSKVTFKGYLALFVCFSTRALHLEVVSSLGTDAFLAALKRFVSRRGRPRDIHSDCGTNFVGAAHEIKEFQAFMKSDSHNQAVLNNLATDGIQWHFNPPSAPHFGGLWEAGVKSVKHHLHRIIGSSRLTFEELTTVMTQIEAILNSRPLTPCSSDPDDLTALTPGHFLIGDAMVAMAEPDLTQEKLNRLSRWQQVQQLTQHFWRRWSKEYLTRLQQRPKWLAHRTEIKIGDMVLIKEDNLPSLQWKLGRVIQVHPGHDGIIRVATIKTQCSEIKRPIVKLCLLPIDSSVETSK